MARLGFFLYHLMLKPGLKLTSLELHWDLVPFERRSSNWATAPRLDKDLLLRPLPPDDLGNWISGCLANDLPVRFVDRKRLVVQLLNSGLDDHILKSRWLSDANQINFYCLLMLHSFRILGDAQIDLSRWLSEANRIDINCLLILYSPRTPGGV